MFFRMEETIWETLIIKNAVCYEKNNYHGQFSLFHSFYWM